MLAFFLVQSGSEVCNLKMLVFLQLQNYSQRLSLLDVQQIRLQLRWFGDRSRLLCVLKVQFLKSRSDPDTLRVSCHRHS
jgi:hypothetical protein